MCEAGQENYCYHRATNTYGGIDRIDGTTTKGAHSREYVLRDKFAFHLPAGLDPAGAAPLLCAGVSVWQPLRAAGVGPGSRVAVAGLGGLGHLAVKIAAALGAFDLILDTISADHALSLLLGMLGLDGTLCVLGNPMLVGPRVTELVAGRKKLTASGTGGLRETVEMLEFCAERGITADVEILPSSAVETALNRLAVGDVRYRFVLDMSDLDPTT